MKHILRKSNFECIYLTVNGKCNENYYLGIDEKYTKTIEDCPKCNKYNNCLYCQWFCAIQVKNTNCSRCNRGD